MTTKNDINVSDSILNKIKKLMKSKESFEKMGSINEAEAFASKIQDLLDEHNLSFGDISMEERIEGFITEEMNNMIPSVGGNTRFDIMFAIAKHNYCRVYLVKINGKIKNMKIIGSVDNVEVCKYIYDVVTPIFMKVGKDKWTEKKAWGYQKGLDTFLRTFLVGCSVGLDKKLAAEKEVKIQATVGLYGLIKVNDAALKQYVAETVGPISFAKGKKIKDGGAFDEGIKTGQNVSINKAITTKSKPVGRKLLN